MQSVPDSKGRRIDIDWASIQHFRLGSTSNRCRSDGLCYLGCRFDCIMIMAYEVIFIKRHVCTLLGSVYRSNMTLRWRHNERDGVSNHQPHDCLLNRLFGSRSKKTSKLRVTGLCVGNSPGTGEFPAQMASNAENVSIWWRHHETGIIMQLVTDYAHGEYIKGVNTIGTYPDYNSVNYIYIYIFIFIMIELYKQISWVE